MDPLDGLGLRVSDWLVVFCHTDASNPRHPWAWQCAGDFNHCFALGFVPTTDCVILLDPTAPRIATHLIAKQDIPKILEAVDGAAFPAKTKVHRNPMIPEVTTCVTWMKHLLGIRAPKVFTPRHLLDYLVSKNETTEDQRSAAASG